jgi:glycosyltransferase 2 family protein
MESTSLLSRARRVLSVAERVVPWLALVAAPVGLLLVLRGQREAVAAVEWHVSWQIAAASALAFAVAPLLQGLSFWLALRLLTGTTPLADAMVVWSRSYVVRYAPTGALAIAYRLASRQRLHASAEQVLAAYGYEHVATLGAGAAACLALFALAGGLPPWPALVIALGALALPVAVCPGALGRALEGLGRRFGIHVPALLPARMLALLVALNAVGWLGTGAGVLLLVTNVTGNAPGFLWLVGAYTAGYLVGFVAPLAPGGVGVREGMLVVLLRARYGLGVAAAISIAIRVVNVAGELLAVGLVHCAYGAAIAVRRGRELLELDSVGARAA